MDGSIHGGIVILVLIVVAAVLLGPHAARVRARRRVPARALLEGKGPGLVILIPVIQQMVRVDLRTVVIDVPPQDVISRDNVSVKVNAVVYFRVVDPQKAIIQVENYLKATSQLAQTTLRAVLGKHELDEMLAEREKLNLDIQQSARRADRRVGHQGHDRRDQAGRPERVDGPRDRPPGRGRARAARQGDPRRGRAAGVGKAAPGGADALAGSPRRCSCATCRR